MQEASLNKQTKTITLGFILGWVLGLAFALIGLMMFTTSPALSTVNLLIAVLLLPPITDFFKNKLHIALSGWLRGFLIFGLFIVYISISMQENVVTIQKSPLPTANQSVPQNNNNIVPASSSNTPVVSENNKKEEIMSKLPDPQMMYQEVFSFQGKGNKKSEPFKIVGDRFKVAYDCKGSLCQAYLYQAGNNFPKDLLMNVTQSIKDETIVYGAGEYYIEANTIGSFTIKVYDYKPGYTDEQINEACLNMVNEISTKAQNGVCKDIGKPAGCTITDEFKKKFENLAKEQIQTCKEKLKQV